MRFSYTLANIVYVKIGFIAALTFLVHADTFASRWPKFHKEAPVHPIADVCYSLEVKGDTGTTYDAAYSPANSDLIVALSSKPKIRIWNTQTRKVLYRFRLESGNIPIVRWHPNRRGILGFAYPDGIFIIINLYGPSGKPIQVLVGKHNGPIRGLLFNASKGELVATLGESDGVRIWNIDKAGDKQIAHVKGSPIGVSSDFDPLQQSGKYHIAGLAWAPSNSLRFATLTGSNQSTIYELNSDLEGSKKFKSINTDYTIQDFMFSPSSENVFAMLNGRHYIDLHFPNLASVKILEKVVNPYIRFTAQSKTLYRLKWNMADESYVGALGLSNNFIEVFNIITRPPGTIHYTAAMVFDFDFNPNLSNYLLTGDAKGNAIVFSQASKIPTYIVSSPVSVSRVQWNPDKEKEFLAVTGEQIWICEANL